MFELIKSGGWLMLPIILCSIAAMAICFERVWFLKKDRVLPEGLLAEVFELIRSDKMTPERSRSISENSPLGTIIVAGIRNARHGREVMRDSIEEAAAQVIHEMERYLNSLGTIAAITPLLGLLGTVIGMIKVFTEIMIQGTGNANVLAGGISEALITTAAGLSIAIPALAMHRYLQRRVHTLVLTMEQEAIKLVEILHDERDDVL